MMDATNEPLDLYDEFFGDEKFDTVSLDAIGDVETGNEPEDWTFVRARTMSRGCTGLYSEGLYQVRSTSTARGSLAERLVELGHGDKVSGGRVKAPSTDAVLQAMPRRERRNDVIPSIHGEYLTLKGVQGWENDDGTITVETSAGFTDTIPVEFVIETLSYDEVVCELLDETMDP